jgi:hypothetical protein
MLPTPKWRQRARAKRKQPASLTKAVREESWKYRLEGYKALIVLHVSAIVGTLALLAKEPVIPRTILTAFAFGLGAILFALAIEQFAFGHLEWLYQRGATMKLAFEKTVSERMLVFYAVVASIGSFVFGLWRFIHWVDGSRHVALQCC